MADRLRQWLSILAVLAILECAWLVWLKVAEEAQSLALIQPAHALADEAQALAALEREGVSSDAQQHDDVS